MTLCEAQIEHKFCQRRLSKFPRNTNTRNGKSAQLDNSPCFISIILALLAFFSNNSYYIASNSYSVGWPCL
jgi:hypothetical protein